MSVMAPLLYLTNKKVLLTYLLLFLFASVLVRVSSETQLGISDIFGGRRVLEEEDIDLPKKKEKLVTSLSSKDQTKPKKPNSSTSSSSLSSKNQTKTIKSSNLSSKNQTKILKSTNTARAKTLSNSDGALTKIELKKLNSTSKLKKLNATSTKSSNSTKVGSSSSKKSLDLIKLSTPKNRTTKSDTTSSKNKDGQLHLSKKFSEKDETDKKSREPQKTQKKKQSSEEDETQMKKKVNPIKKDEKSNKLPKLGKPQKPKLPSWVDEEEDDDLVSQFRDLPTRFHQTLLPDLEKLSTTSRAYITKANKEMTKGFKPYVGNKYAPTIASIVSFVFMLVPLLLVSLIFNRIQAYFSLQKLLIFIQVYLSIYFSILCLTSLVTGLEPLKYLYTTSPSTYVCLQIMQTLGYVLHLLMLLMYLILVFSTECGLGSRLLGLAQTFVGFAVGLHYYVAVFHRMVLHQPPKTDWKVHGIYGMCFLVVCLFSRAERRKKAYLEEGGEEGKQS